MQLIPSIDLRAGRVVRLEQGDDGRRTTYDVEGAEIVERYMRAGVERIHVVDLDAAFGEPRQHEALDRLLAVEGRPPLQLGGGIRDRSSAVAALDGGIERVVVTSLIVRDFDVFVGIVDDYPGRVVAALDIGRDRLKLAGWTEEAARTWREVANDLSSLPLAAVLVTDIERDGTLRGPNVELACEVARATGVGGIVSGGVREIADLERAALREEIDATIVGKALYDGAFTVEAALEACRREAAV